MTAHPTTCSSTDLRGLPTLALDFSARVAWSSAQISAATIGNFGLPTGLRVVCRTLVCSCNPSHTGLDR